jgi:hypothetical protein
VLFAAETADPEAEEEEEEDEEAPICDEEDFRDSSSDNDNTISVSAVLSVINDDGLARLFMLSP